MADRLAEACRSAAAAGVRVLPALSEGGELVHGDAVLARVGLALGEGAPRG